MNVYRNRIIIETVTVGNSESESIAAVLNNLEAICKEVDDRDRLVECQIITNSLDLPEAWDVNCIPYSAQIGYEEYLDELL